MISVQNAFEAGQYDALAKLGFAPAVMAAGRAAIGAAKPAAGMAARAFGLGGRQAMKSLGAAGKAGMGSLQQSMPGMAKGLQTAGKVLSNPMAQMGMMAAPMMAGAKQASTPFERLVLKDPAAKDALMKRVGGWDPLTNVDSVRKAWQHQAAKELAPEAQSALLKELRPDAAFDLGVARYDGVHPNAVKQDWMGTVRDVEGVGPRGNLP